MELNIFLEQDIREFLDREVEKQQVGKKIGMEQTGLFQSVTDFRTETESALARGDVHRARVLFEQARHAYETSTGVQKEQLAIVLKDLQAKAASHYAHMQATQNLFKELEDLTEGKGQNMHVSLFAPIASNQEVIESSGRRIERAPEYEGEQSLRSPVQMIRAPTITVGIPTAPQSTTIRAPEVKIIRDDAEMQRLRKSAREQESRINALEKQLSAKNQQQVQTPVVQAEKKETVQKPKNTEKQIEELIESIGLSVKAGQIKTAMQTYQQVKRLYNTLPTAGQKKYRTAISRTHETIRNSITPAKQEIRAITLPPSQEIPKPVQKEEPQKEIIAPKPQAQGKELHELIEEIRRAVSFGDVNTAENRFLELHKALAQNNSKPIQDILARIRHEIAVVKHTRPKNNSIDENTMYMKGVFYLVSGNTELAKTQFQEILKQNPNHYAAKMRLEQAQNR